MARTLADAYRRFGADAAGTSPLYERVALAVSASAAALRAIEAAPARKRQPALIFAALHDLALAGRAPALAAAYQAGDGDAAAVAAIDTLVREAGAVTALAARRTVKADETGRCAVLYPAVAEAARRLGADAVGLIDLGCSAGLNLNVDRVAVTYGKRTAGKGLDSQGTALGDPASPVRMAATTVGDRPVPATAIPEVVARVVADLDPLDVTDADDVRWLRACVWPDQPAAAARLDAEVALASTRPPELLRGDPVDLLSEAVARVPAGALPIVLTTWVLSRYPAEERERFPPRLAEAAAGRAVAWVSVEGVGVAPGVPTLGDRPASGHSIIGLTLCSATGGAAAPESAALGRCWLRGRMLEWPAE